jgi:hypothetical protein
MKARIPTAAWKIRLLCTASPVAWRLRSACCRRGPCWRDVVLGVRTNTCATIRWRSLQRRTSHWLDTRPARRPGRVAQQELDCARTRVGDQGPCHRGRFSGHSETRAQVRRRSGRAPAQPSATAAWTVVGQVRVTHARMMFDRGCHMGCRSAVHRKDHRRNGRRDLESPCDDVRRPRSR